MWFLVVLSQIERVIVPPLLPNHDKEEIGLKNQDMNGLLTEDIIEYCSVSLSAQVVVTKDENSSFKEEARHL